MTTTTTTTTTPTTTTVCNPCIPNPCLNGGVCYPYGPTSYTCSCPTNCYGQTCQFLYNGMGGGMYGGGMYGGGMPYNGGGMWGNGMMGNGHGMMGGGNGILAPKATTNDPNSFNVTTCTCLASLTSRGNFLLSAKIQASCSNGYYVQIKKIQVENANSSSCYFTNGIYPLSGLVATRLTRLCSSDDSACSTDQFLSSEIYSSNYSIGSCFLVTQVWSCSAQSPMYPFSPSPSDSSGRVFT